MIHSIHSRPNQTSQLHARRARTSIVERRNLLCGKGLFWLFALFFSSPLAAQPISILVAHSFAIANYGYNASCEYVERRKGDY